MLLLLTFWVEERRALKGSRALSMMHGNNPTPAADTPSDRALDGKFTELQPINPRRSDHDLALSMSDGQPFQARSVLYHVLFILRHASLKSLHTYFGWHASPPEIERARRSIAQWIQYNPKTARRCVFHAALAFCRMRNADALCFPYLFCLLVVVQYLSIYQREHNSSPRSPDRAIMSSATENTTNSQSQGTRVLRIKPGQSEQDDLIRKWISGDETLIFFFPVWVCY
ncbi:hypothetical protein BDV11DRAFT_200384 [Aspergillus similis]